MSLPASDEPSRQARRGWRGYRFQPSDLVTALLLVVAIVGVLEIIPASGYILFPGQATPVEPMLRVPGHPIPRGKGKIYLTDVSLFTVHHLLEEIYGKLNPDAQYYPAQEVAGNLSEKQYMQYNLSLMSQSQQDAQVAALSAVKGYEPRLKPPGPEIAFVYPRSPAARALKAGDRIVAIDGKRIRRAAQVPSAIRSHRPGQVVRITILRTGVRHTYAIRTVSSIDGQPKHGKIALVGIVVQNLYTLPVKVSINAGDIGGPSAGLAFTLGIVERLEGHDITKGCPVAVTGTIDSAGNVGAIGGAKQKAIAAGRAGARYFLVPQDPGDVHDARSSHSSVQVVPVSTLRQALTFLNQLKPCR